MTCVGDEGWPGRTGWGLSGREKEAERDEPEPMDARRALDSVFSKVLAASSRVDVAGLRVRLANSVQDIPGGGNRWRLGRVSTKVKVRNL